MPLDENDKYSIEKKIGKMQMASFAKIRLVEQKLDESTKLSIIGNTTDAASTGKFILLDTTKVYVATNNITLNNIKNKWYYYNQITTTSGLTAVTINDVDFLTDNLDQSLAIYIDQYTITTFRNQIMTRHILYYKNMIENQNPTSSN